MQAETKKRITALLDVRNPRHQRLWEAAKTIEKGQQSEVILALFEDAFDLTGPRTLGQQVFDYLSRRESGLPLPPRAVGASAPLGAANEVQGGRQIAPASPSIPAQPASAAAAPTPAPRRQNALSGLTAGD